MSTALTYEAFKDAIEDLNRGNVTPPKARVIFASQYEYNRIKKEAKKGGREYVRRGRWFYWCGYRVIPCTEFYAMAL